MHLYTICSYSNLHQAIVLYNSIKENTKTPFSFSLFLIDEIPSDFSFKNESIQLIRETELSSILPEFKNLKSKYTAFEFCCALKPFCANYLLGKVNENEKIVYLDSDICFYDDIHKISEEIGDNNILLTPHFWSPPPNFTKISELDINNSGLYNGGFFAIKKCPETIHFIEWWKQRMNFYCYTDFSNGMFVDQIWLNHVPLFFKNVLLSKNVGFNVAYWNFHEKKVFRNESGKWIVNNNTPLLFFHFSGFRLYRKDLISIHQTRYSFNALPEIQNLFLSYSEQLETTLTKYDLKILKRSLIEKITSKIKSFF